MSCEGAASALSPAAACYQACPAGGTCVQTVSAAGALSVVCQTQSFSADICTLATGAAPLLCRDICPAGGFEGCEYSLVGDAGVNGGGFVRMAARSRCRDPSTGSIFTVASGSFVVPA